MDETILALVQHIAGAGGNIEYLWCAAPPLDGNRAVRVAVPRVTCWVTHDPVMRNDRERLWFSSVFESSPGQSRTHIRAETPLFSRLSSRPFHEVTHSEDCVKDVSFT